MQSFVDDLVKQSTDNGMNVNERYMKEMLISSIVKDQPPQLTLDGVVVDKVTTFKLLGVHVCMQQSQVDSARRCNIVQCLVSTLLYETAQTPRCVHRQLTVLLHNSGASSARVCLSDLAVKSDSRPARGTAVITCRSGLSSTALAINHAVPVLLCVCHVRGSCQNE